MDRHPVLVTAHAAGARRQGHDGAVDAILAGAQPVCPGIQDRDAHGLACGDVGVEAAALAEELVVTVGERRDDHACLRDDGRGQRRRGILQRDGLELGHPAILSRSADEWIVLDAPCVRALGEQGRLGRRDHLRPAAQQDLPVAPTSVPRDHVGQRAGLAHVQPAGRLDVGIVGRPTADWWSTPRRGSPTATGSSTRPARASAGRRGRTDSARRRTGAPAGSRQSG